MAETIRLEEYTGVIQNKFVSVWLTSDLWLPTEFLLTQYITRILVIGRTSPISVGLGSDASWTQIWRSPGAKEWSCLLGVLQHMPGPVLIVVGPDVALTPKISEGLKGVTTVALRVPGLSVGGVSDHVFFPVLNAAVMPTIQEWTTKAVPRSLDLKVLVPQLLSQGYGLTIAEGVWHWFTPADSAPLVTATVSAVARQLQTLGLMLEKMTV